ncbi:hypothetical protein [Halochromatium glycolicum]|uniref:hypothetical protein n=1 Tax=Halochromatium glycolicum TaxID=85075 RepID=UPI00190AC459
MSRLVALNAERAAEEACGRVRWLRPEFQNPDGQGADGLAVDGGAGTAPEPAAAAKRPWP